MHQASMVSLFAACTLGAFGTTSRLPQRGDCGDAAGGVRLCLASTPATGVLSVEIRNDGSTDAMVDIGVMLANGTHQYPNAITLSLQDTGAAAVEGTSLDPAGVAGRLDPLLVPLPAGASIRVPLRLARYVFRAAGRRGTLELAGEQRSIRAKLSGRRPGGSELSGYWTATAVSNPITLVMPALSSQ